jgi:two-component system sensor histidine kinase ChiS
MDPRSHLEGRGGVLLLRAPGSGIRRFWAGLLAMFFLATGSWAGEAPLRWTSCAYPPSFERISVKHGLSQNTVHCMLQDRKGFLWFGTDEGLNRYDGFQFQVFHTENPQTTSGDEVLHLMEDSRGCIWMAIKNGGMRILDPETQRMMTVPVSSEPGGLPARKVSALAEDREGNIWVATTTHGLWRVNRNWNFPEQPRFQSFVSAPKDPTGAPAGDITGLFVDGNGIFWIGSRERGLGRLVSDLGGGRLRFEYFPHDPAHPETSAPRLIYAFAEDPFGLLWLGSDKGIFLFDPTRGISRKCLEVEGETTRIGESLVPSVLRDSEGVMWVASDGPGLLKALPRRDREDPVRFRRFSHNAKDPRSLSGNGLQCIFEDRSGVLWVSAFHGGLNKLVLHPNRPGQRERPSVFQFRNNASDPFSLSGNTVAAVGEDRFGNLWIGTDGFGLNRVIRPKKPGEPLRFERFREDPRPGSLQTDVILTTHLDAQQNLWLGSYNGGLIRVDLASATAKPRFTHFRSVRSDPTTLSSNFVRCILDDGEGGFWVGLDGRGFNHFDPRTGKAKRYEWGEGPRRSSNEEVFQALRDGFGTLWLATAHGLNRFNPATEEFRVYLPGAEGSISHALINTLHLDETGTLWIGTGGGGLNRLTIPPWEGPEPRFTHYGISEGLPGNVIKGLLPGGDGQLWLSMGHALCRFQIAEGRAYPFTWQSELQNAEFIQNARFRGPGGELFFGSNEGLTLFQPEDIVPNRLPAPVAITGFQIRNKPLPLEARITRRVAGQDPQEISLHPDDAMFSFDFAALNFRAPDKNQYAYMLEGLDTSWNEIGNKHAIAYTTLPPGRYVLRIRASNCDGVWDPTGLRLGIQVLPPWWKTWWLRSLALLAVISVLGLVYRMRLRRLKSLNLMLETRVRQRTSQLEEANLKLQELESNKAKLVAMLVHDIRSPLTSVGLALDLYQQEGNLSVKHLDICKHSLQNTLGMLRDLQEVYRSDADQLVLDLKEHAPGDILRQIHESHLPECENKGILLKLELEPELPRLRCDAPKFERAVVNLLVNALKFTQAGGEIVIEARQLHGKGVESGLHFLLVIVSDNGRGIPSESLPSIFDPYRQTSSLDRNLGVGLGLAIVQQIMNAHQGRVTVRSQVGVGTSFTLFFPVQRTL